MRLTTVATYPKSYSQPIDPSRTTQGPAGGTGDAGVSFVDDFKHPGSLLALVIQEIPEHAPSGIQHRLCHPGFGQLETAHVANKDFLIPLNYLPRKFVQRIGPAARGLAMNPFRLALVATTLG
jgi:hypothetical protein